MNKDKNRNASEQKKKQHKKSKKKILFSIISFLLVIAMTVPIVVFSLPQDPIVNDNTAFGESSKTENPDGVISGTNDATLSPSLNVLSNDDSKKVESSVTAVSMIEESLVLDIQKGSPLDSIEVGEIFMLQGDENSFLGEIYFGKVVSKIDQNDHYKYA